MKNIFKWSENRRVNTVGCICILVAVIAVIFLGCFLEEKCGGDHYTPNSEPQYNVDRRLSPNAHLVGKDIAELPIYNDYYSHTKNPSSYSDIEIID